VYFAFGWEVLHAMRKRVGLLVCAEVIWLVGSKFAVLRYDPNNQVCLQMQEVLNEKLALGKSTILFVINYSSSLRWILQPISAF
jgi:hypothetical protein